MHCTCLRPSVHMSRAARVKRLAYAEGTTLGVPLLGLINYYYFVHRSIAH